jgi:PIN domain nuclease of toxin-antitoxin system
VTYLLDTAVVFWALTDPGELSRKARRICEDPAAKRVISVASLWELSVKASLGAIEIRNVETTLPTWITALNARMLPLEAAHAYAVYGLPMLHKDPFDRMLIAQAVVEDLVLVTSDEHIQRYDVKWVW